MPWVGLALDSDIPEQILFHFLVSRKILNPSRSTIEPVLQIPTILSCRILSLIIEIGLNFDAF